MPAVMTLADGQGMWVDKVTAAQLRDLMFSNAAVPAGSGIVKPAGNPPAYVQIPAAENSWGKDVAVKQSNVVAVSTE